jgi:hypothetical protein
VWSFIRETLQKQVGRRAYLNKKDTCTWKVYAKTLIGFAGNGELHSTNS